MLRLFSGARVVGVSLAVLAWSGAVRAQHEHHGGAAAETLGTVEFPTSCRPETRAGFNRAVALLHSFEFRDAIGGFDTVLAADPSCAIAHWGRALAFWGNPFAPGVKGGKPCRTGVRPPRPPVPPVRPPRASGRTSRRLQSSTGTRMPRRSGRACWRTRRGMERVSRENPDDMEATIFYALAVNQTALPTDKTYAQQLKAVSLLEPLFAKHPDHPGLAHYIIHACDHPPLAPRALDAARRYAKIAPSAPHALHMPSHTFTRVGLWQESIDTNITSADSAMKIASYAEALHAMDYRDVRVPADRAGRCGPAGAGSRARPWRPGSCPMR